MVDPLAPGGEQPVQLRQVRDAGPVADLDQELFPHSPEKAFYFAPAFRPAGRAVRDLDAQPRRGPVQRRIDEGRTVAGIYPGRNAAGGQRRAQRGGQPDRVLEIAPAGRHHRPRVVVDEAEQERLPARDHRAVQRIPSPHLIRSRALEPAEDLRRPPVRPGPQLQPLEVPLQRPHRR
jgi:hypothetical protein